MEVTRKLPYGRRRRALRWKSKIQEYKKQKMVNKDNSPVELTMDDIRFIWGDPSEYRF